MASSRKEAGASPDGSVLQSDPALSAAEGAKIRGATRDTGPSPLFDPGAGLTPIPPHDRAGKGAQRRRRVRTLLGAGLIYSLLIGGSLIFTWPFLWMATTSWKLDREMFAEQVDLWPQQPVPQQQSPYIDETYFFHVDGPRMDELLPLIEQQLREMDYRWPEAANPQQMIKQVARGIYRKLELTLPVDTWEKPLPVLWRTARERINATLVEQVLSQVRRVFGIGSLRARSLDLEEAELVPADRASALWEVSGDGRAEIIGLATEALNEVHYDFGSGTEFAFSRTFELPFDSSRLYRLQLALRNDNTFHKIILLVEKEGSLYRSSETDYLADITPIDLIWQLPLEEETAGSVKNWTDLEIVASGPGFESRPRHIRVTVKVTENSPTGAWAAKMWRNYRRVFEYVPFWRYTATSAFLVIVNIAATLFSCSLIAYAFARLQWPGRSFCFVLMLATMMIPQQVTLIPQFLIIRELGWYDTLLPLWVTQFFGNAFFIFLLVQFLRGIPRDLEDAARMDGCGFWRVYWHIMLPLVKPSLAAIAIFTFMNTWNDFMGPLIYLNDERLYPLSLGLFALNVAAPGGASGMGMMMAGSLMMTLPVIIIFFFAQKYFLQGVTLTGMKG